MRYEKGKYKIFEAVDCTQFKEVPHDKEGSISANNITILIEEDGNIKELLLEEVTSLFVNPRSYMFFGQMIDEGFYCSYEITVREDFSSGNIKITPISKKE